MFQIQVAYKIYDLQIFSPILWDVFFCFLDRIVCRTDVVYFDEVQFIFSHLGCSRHLLAPREPMFQTI